MKIRIPVLQLWAPQVGWILGTAYGFEHGVRAARASMAIVLSDRKANGSAFKGERVRQRTAWLTVGRNGSTVDVAVME
jgi:hypothetical protein